MTKYQKIFSLRGICIILLCSAGSCYFLNSLLAVLNTVLPEDIMSSYSESIYQSGIGREWKQTFKSIVLAPLAEEILYRGILFEFFKRKIFLFQPYQRAYWGANILQALLFGILHWNLIQGIYAFLCGLLVGFMVDLFQSLLPAILTHMLINILSVFTWSFVAEWIGGRTEVFLVFSLFMFICITEGICLGKEYREKNMSLENN